MKRTIRTFLAVEIAAAARSRAVELIRALAAAGADVKWVDAQNLHFTLKFLDEVPLTEIPQICAVVSRAVATVEPFESRGARRRGFSQRGPTKDRLAWRRAGAGADDRPARGTGKGIEKSSAFARSIGVSRPT